MNDLDFLFINKEMYFNRDFIKKYHNKLSCLLYQINNAIQYLKLSNKSEIKLLGKLLIYKTEIKNEIKKLKIDDTFYTKYSVLLDKYYPNYVFAYSEYKENSKLINNIQELLI